MHQQGTHSVLEECLQTLRNDSFDTRERDTIITIITFVLYSFMYLFIYSFSGVHDSRDTRERYYFLLLLLLLFIHSFIHSFMYLAEGMTRVILERDTIFY